MAMKTKLVHCSYHKCLTVYYIKVFSTLYNRLLRFSSGYHHFNSCLDEFDEGSGQFKISSINNHSLDLKMMGNDVHITRFIRDPRDLIVSGYFYHRKGAEDWCNIVNPNEGNWRIVNGVIPKAMFGKGQSFSAFLQNISMEEGLMAEIEFRENHFRSMKAWPIVDERIRLFRYEDMIGNEKDVFKEMMSHYGVSWPEKKVGSMLAERYSARKQTNKLGHIRNPQAGQWKEHFTPMVTDYFEKRHGEILELYGYD